MKRGAVYGRMQCPSLKGVASKTIELFSKNKCMGNIELLYRYPLATFLVMYVRISTYVRTYPVVGLSNTIIFVTYVRVAILRKYLLYKQKYW